MNRYNTLLIIVLLLTNLSFSQDFSSSNKNSFFLGKRGLIEVGLNPRWSIIDNGKGDVLSKLTMGSFAEYTFAFSNKISTTINIGRNTYFRRPLEFLSEYDSDNSRQIYIGEMDDAKAIKTNRLGIRINKALMAKKGAIAPMGHYVGIGLQFLMNSLEYIDNPISKYYIDDFQSFGDKRVVIEQAQILTPLNFNSWSIDLYYGARKNVTKDIFISWSISTALTSYFTSLNIENPFSEKHNPYDIKENYEDITRNDLIKLSRHQMRINNFFNFRIGIGMILH